MFLVPEKMRALEGISIYLYVQVISASSRKLSKHVAEAAASSHFESIRCEIHRLTDVWNRRMKRAELYGNALVVNIEDG